MYSAWLAILSLGAPVKVRAQMRQQGGVPIVVFVHGRGQPVDSIAAVRKRFVNTFRETQLALFHSQVVPDDDIAFVWYADVLDPGAERPPQSAQCMSATTQAMLTQSWMDGLRKALIGFATAAHLDAPLLHQFMADTYDYLASETARCEANMRVELTLNDDAVRGRPVVLVAHSMGGIVSFAALAENARTLDTADRFKIARLVTIGTQVGVRQVLSGLDGSYTRLPVPEPISIRSWRNFQNDRDMLAFPAKSSFSASDHARQPRDVIIQERGDAHAATTYLSSPKVVVSILQGWCASYPRRLGKPAACASVERMPDP